METLISVLLVVIGGAVGAGSRYLLGGWIHGLLGSEFPWGTFIINITGSLLIGVAIGLTETGILSANARSLIATGILGGFTTFSTFSFEAMLLLSNGGKHMAMLYVFGQIIIGLIAVYLGFVFIHLMMA